MKCAQCVVNVLGLFESSDNILLYLIMLYWIVMWLLSHHYFCYLIWIKPEGFAALFEFWLQSSTVPRPYFVNHLPGTLVVQSTSRCGCSPVVPQPRSRRLSRSRSADPETTVGPRGFYSTPPGRPWRSEPAPSPGALKSCIGGSGGICWIHQRDDPDDSRRQKRLVPGILPCIRGVKSSIAPDE